MKTMAVALSATIMGVCGTIFIAAHPVGYTVGKVSAIADYPARKIRLVHGFGPGTAPDLTARVFGQKLSQAWGTPVIIENVMGAAGNRAGEYVSRAEPDGLTLLLAASSGVVMNPNLYGKMTYDPIEDLIPISILYSYPNILAVNIDLPANSVQELVALARTRPRALTFASPGAGTTAHLAAEMLKSMANIDMQHVPYRGGVNLVTDLITGRVDIYFGTPTSTLDQAQEGKVRALAVSSSKRYAGALDLPTMAEAGFPDFDLTVWCV